MKKKIHCLIKTLKSRKQRKRKFKELEKIFIMKGARGKHSLIGHRSFTITLKTQTSSIKDRVEVSKLASTEQEIHVIIKVRSSNLNWLLSAIYASPRCAERQILWGNLKMMAEVHDLPWVMAGDFNEPLMEGDKFGGKGLSVNRALLFKECLDACSMIDLGFSGPQFTWTNRREIQAFIQERIDRFFCEFAFVFVVP